MQNSSFLKLGVNMGFPSKYTVLGNTDVNLNIENIYQFTLIEDKDTG